jgi:hypothetical protein
LGRHEHRLYQAVFNRVFEVHWSHSGQRLRQYQEASQYDVCITVEMRSPSNADFAKFGKITDGSADEGASPQTTSGSYFLLTLFLSLIHCHLYKHVPESTVLSPSGEPFKPSRRVRQAPGGGHTDIFAHDDEGDALSMAPPKPPQLEQVRGIGC